MKRRYEVDIPIVRKLTLCMSVEADRPERAWRKAQKQIAQELKSDETYYRGWELEEIEGDGDYPFMLVREAK